MTVDKAVNVLIKAGLLDQADAPTAAATLAYPSNEMTCPAWAKALAKAGMLNESNIKTATAALEKAGRVEAEDDPEAFKDGLENAGIL